LLVRCPQCKIEFRLVDYSPDEREVRYLCPGCREIVPVDLERDEVQSSSSSGSFRNLERRRTVIVADRTGETRDRAGRILRDAGFDVLSASDGLETLRLIRDERPDGVLLDLLLPRKSGFEVLRELGRDEEFRNTPVLAMSGVYGSEVVELVTELGARGFIGKEEIDQSLAFRVRRLVTREAIN